MEKVLMSLTDLEHEAKALTERLVPRKDKGTVITLSGELGAGKTTFTQAIAKAYGVSQSITSPTFVLEKVYKLPEATGFFDLIHIDAYRLENAEELRILGWDALIQEPGNLVIIEWPENVPGAIPDDAMAIQLIVNTDGSRTLSYA